MADTPKYTASDWDTVRTAFTTSIMVDTSLSSLAQNLEGPDWPIKATGETPAAYIDLNYDEMREMLTLKGYPKHADLLISILQDTLSFDDPFGDMVQQADAASERDNPLIKNLGKLGVDESFPITLTAVDGDTREFCKLEGLGTLGEFAKFAQGMSQNVIVGGDFRKLLNALSHLDERGLAEVLPFRPGAKGLHLIEALGQADRAASPGAHTEAALKYFSTELDELKARIVGGAELSREVIVLGNPAAEARVTAVLAPLVGAKVETKKGGFLSRLFGKG